MLKRILTAILGIPFLILIISLGGTPLLISLMIITSVGLFELHSTFKIKHFKINIYLEIAMSLILLCILNFRHEFTLPYFTILFLLHLILQLFLKEPSFFDGILGFLSILYVSFLLGHLLLFDELPLGNYLIWLVFIIAWSTDTFAYFTGLNFGKRKLCPHISPKKTIEGSIGGIVGSLTISIVYYLYLKYLQNLDIAIIHFIILSIITSVIAQFGDLTASMIKRNFEVKDFGKIFPGHGGILDRFDSILFTAPIVYYYISIFM